MRTCALGRSEEVLSVGDPEAGGIIDRHGAILEGQASGRDDVFPTRVIVLHHPRPG